MKILKKLSVLGVVLAAVVSTGCHKTKSYESTVEITRLSVVRRDENGRALTTDVEMAYADCPGTQVENVRGGEDFSTCMTKHHIGEKLKVKLEHKWTEEGHYEWDVLQVGDCKRPVDPNDEFSFSTIRECEDWTVSGAKVGFTCSIKPAKELLKKCPWFGKH